MNLVKSLCRFIALFSPTIIGLIDSVICLSQDFVLSILVILEIEIRRLISNIASFFKTVNCIISSKLYIFSHVIFKYLIYKICLTNDCGSNF